MHNLLHDAIYSTLIYSDLFDYPLTKEELWKYFVSSNSKCKIQHAEFQEELENLLTYKKVSKIEEFYCLKGKEKIVVMRKRRMEISKPGLKKAQWVSHILAYIPTICFIGISGSLAMNNMDKEGDIDLFIIVSPKTIWVTRLCVMLFLQLLGIRRKRLGKPQGSVVCANMFLDEHNLVLPKMKHNLYTAREIVQLHPLLDKNATYTKFVRANSWIKGYMPNALEALNRKHKALSLEKDSKWIFLLQLLEPVARFFQYRYMKKHITSEIVSDTLLAFHPKDYERTILDEYKKSLKRYKISFDNF